MGRTPPTVGLTGLPELGGGGVRLDRQIPSAGVVMGMEAARRGCLASIFSLFSPSRRGSSRPVMGRLPGVAQRSLPVAGIVLLAAGAPRAYGGSASASTGDNPQLNGLGDRNSPAISTHVKVIAPTFDAGRTLMAQPTLCALLARIMQRRPSCSRMTSSTASRRRRRPWWPPGGAETRGPSFTGAVELPVWGHQYEIRIDQPSAGGSLQWGYL